MIMVRPQFKTLEYIGQTPVTYFNIKQNYTEPI
jgi:hypothetical protein